MGRATSGFVDVTCGVECEGWSVEDEDDEDDVLCVCTEGDAPWGCESSETCDVAQFCVRNDVETVMERRMNGK
jgi:hypothetical protein